MLVELNASGQTKPAKEASDAEASQFLDGEDMASLKTILLAIRKLDSSMNTQFNDLLVSLAGMQSVLATNTSLTWKRLALIMSIAFNTWSSSAPV